MPERFENLGSNESLEEGEKIELEDWEENWEYPLTDENPEEKIDEIVLRESYQKAELFCIKKGAKNTRIHALTDGSYIVERLDDKGEQEEAYYFDKNGDLIKFVDTKYTKKELEKTAQKIKENFLKIQNAMVEMLENDPVYSKITKH